MNYEYIYSLASEDVDTLRSDEQWAAQYNRRVAFERKFEANQLRENWKNVYLTNNESPGLLVADFGWQTELGLIPIREGIMTGLANLPFCSFFIHFRFVLSTPYISLEDSDFHIIDNPIVREKVFRWPMVQPSGWKGSLRHALWQLGYDEEDTNEKGEQVKRLFGTANDERVDEGKRGRLYFYPTFFTETSLEIINPHDREKRVGKNPILMECVPAEVNGAFTLLYVPFDRIGEDGRETSRQVAADLQLVAEGVRTMMTTYGFGAKTSSGFGTANDELASEGRLVIRAALGKADAMEPTPQVSPQPELPRYLQAPGRLHADFRRDDGNLKSEEEYRAWVENRGGQYKKKDKQLYDKARKWWESEGKKTQESLVDSQTESESSPPTGEPALSERRFLTLRELTDVAGEVAASLQKEAGHE